MTSTNYELIRGAITAKHQVVGIYKGLRREMIPHALGHTDGHERALVLQVGGESSKGLPDGGAWRCMDVSLLQELEVVAADWFSRDGHSRPQTCVQFVDVEVGP